jgi:PAS domain S-box-containing protein
VRWEAEKARLLLEAARYLGETLEPIRVYDRFRELLADAVPHDGVVVSAYDEADGSIECRYAWVGGNHLDVSQFPVLKLDPAGGGMQSRVIRTGEPLVENDVRAAVKRRGTYYDIDREGHMRKVPDEGAPGTRAALMLPVRHEGRVIGVVQVMSDRIEYSDEQLELAEGLVAQMAAAARNARLAEERNRLAEAEAAAKAVAAEREQVARVLAAVGDGIMLVDEAGAIRFWNRAAEVMTGLAAEEVSGRPAREVLSPWSAIEGGVPVAEGSAVGQPVTLPVDVNGRELWLSFLAVQSQEGAVYTFRDLTVEQHLETAKSDFIATISHELRTPMTAVLGAASTLLRPDIELTEDLQRQLLEMIAGQAARLTRVTEEVLLVSSLDRGELRVDATRVEIDEVVRETVEAMRSQVPPETHLALAETHGGAAVGDRHRVQQVLVNLIDNAAKYAPGGRVEVSAERADGVVRVSVRDEGPGIPHGEQQRIFEKFYRGDPQLTHAPSGTGLGLYVCRELVERMGGKIRVSSERGRGSTFSFELPAL